MMLNRGVLKLVKGYL